MKRSSTPEKDARPKAALLWDESFLWGLMSYKALRASGLPFDLVRSGDIRKGSLKDYSLLFVPGGWASNKIKSLGDDGVSGIKEFVSKGGNYLGFCGGAGLATLDGIGLLNVKRKPTRERVPSFSGRIRLSIKGHPIWKDLSGSPGSVTPDSHRLSPVFHAWWPSQFVVGEDVEVLATYGEPMPDAFSSDLNVGDARVHGNWSDLEQRYGINLDPGRLLSDPAAVEGRYGKGRVLLSLVHFDTPDDTNGASVLRNLWGYLAGGEAARSAGGECDRRGVNDGSALPHNLVNASSELEARVGELIDLGTRNFLWFWRNPMLLQWRRGVRGLEYCALYVMTREIAAILRSRRSGFSDDEVVRRIERGLERVRPLLMPFVDDAGRLLVLERLAMQNSHITYERCDDPEIRKIRTELFSNSKSHGGLFKELVDEIDSLLFSLLNAQ